MNARLSISQQQRVRQLLTHEELGDRKPSQFLRHLQSLAGEDVPEEFIRSIWVSRLPDHVQAIMAAQGDLPLETIARIVNKMQELKPTPVVRHGATPVFVSKDLQTASHVFLRQDAVRKSLQAPYVGPCKVIKRGDKTFVIEFNGKVVTVSVDRVKPAFILSSPDPVSKPAVVEDRCTRSGRRVRFPDYFRP